MKKKLVIMSEALGGGVRRHIIDLIENLDKDMFEIYFIYNLDRADTIIRDRMLNFKDENINLIEIKNFNRELGISDIGAFCSIYNELKKIKPDIVHCHSSKAGALGRVAAKMLRVNQIYYTPHAYYFQNPKFSEYKKLVYVKIESILSKYFTTKTINVSQGEKNIAIDYRLDKEDKFHVIYNGIEKIEKLNKQKIKNLKDEFGINENDLVIGVIARLNSQKDPDTFVNIAKKISEKYKNVKFIYVGDGDLYNHIKLRIEFENISNVILTGFRKDTDDILNIFDIFLTTALYEGMPYSLIEALRANLPIVATDTIGNNEIVINRLNGYLIEIQNSDDGFKAIKNLIENKDIIKMLGKESLKKYSNEFTIENMILKYQNLYIDKV